MANHLHWYTGGNIGAADAETVYEVTVQDDRFLPILEDTVFHANVDYLISLDLI